MGSCLFLPLFLISNHDRRSLQHVVSRLIFFFPIVLLGFARLLYKSRILFGDRDLACFFLVAFCAISFLVNQGSSSPLLLVFTTHKVLLICHSIRRISTDKSRTSLDHWVLHIRRKLMVGLPKMDG